jgi:hypothetical protein
VKRGSKPVQRLNEKAIQLRGWIQKLVKMADATRAGITEEDSALDRAMVKISANGELVSTAIDDVITGLGMASKEKWDPKKAPKNFFATGALVAVRAPDVKRFDGAYEKADLASLRVVSVHDKKAKVEVFRDNLKGECLGLVPMRWLQARD